MKSSSFYFLFSKLLIVFLFLVFCFLNSGLVFAQEGLTITPTIIEEKAKARDLLEFSVKISNFTNSTVRLYPLVNDISEKESLDKTISLAKWIEIPRGRIELLAGEEREIPFSIQINLNAKPGKYYAAIIFAQGPTRPEAEANALKFSQPQLLLNIEVQEHIIERAQIVKFETEKRLLFSFPIRFFLEIENIGNREIRPSGSIHIYNRRGEEIGTLDLIETIIPVESKEFFLNIWQADKGFGQYKAVLLAEYGEKEKRDLQDTVYFWIFPWKFLIFSGIGFLFLILLLVWLIFKKSKRRHYQGSQLDKVIDLRH